MTTAAPAVGTISTRRYHRLKSKGVCVCCTGERGPDGTSVRCRDCADDCNAYTAAAKIKRLARVMVTP